MFGSSPRFHSSLPDIEIIGHLFTVPMLTILNIRSRSIPELIDIGDVGFHSSTQPPNFSLPNNSNVNGSIDPDWGSRQHPERHGFRFTLPNLQLTRSDTIATILVLTILNLDRDCRQFRPKKIDFDRISTILIAIIPKIMRFKHHLRASLCYD